MRILIIILLYFNAFGQVDTIQPPCNLTRQQTRLWYNAIKLDLKLKDDQHKRENTKEIKSLKYGVRSLRLENKNIKREYEFKQDSIKRSNKLLLAQERNRTKEIQKTLRNENNKLKRESNKVKREQKIEKAKVKNLTYTIWAVGIVACLLLVLLIIARIKK